MIYFPVLSIRDFGKHIKNTMQNTAENANAAKRGRKPKAKGRKGNGRKGCERSKGAGTLEFRKRKGYFARWTVNGKRFSKLIGHVSLADAEKALADLVAPYRVRDEIARAEMLQGRIDGAKARLERIEAASPAMRLDEAFDAYRDSPLRPDTANENRLMLVGARFGFFVEFMKESYPDIVELRQVTQAHAQAFSVSRWVNKKSPSTYNAIIAICSLVYKVLADDERARIGNNPFAKIKRKHETPFKRRELTTEELRRVCAFVSGELRVLFAIGIYTGLRLSDCVFLKWGNVDLARRIITVTPRKTSRKTGATVTIPIHGELLAVLNETPANDRAGYVIPELAEMYAKTPMCLINRIKAVFNSCGIETQEENKSGVRAHVVVGFHSLRHTFVSLCANSGVPLALVQSITGHARVEMTRHYFHANENALKTAIAALPSVGGAVTPESEAEAVAGRFRAFREAVDGMTDAERVRALDYLKNLSAVEVTA